MTDLELMQSILDEVQSDYGLGGLSDGLYADYAADVARKYHVRKVIGKVDKKVQKLVDSLIAGAEQRGFDRAKVQAAEMVTALSENLGEHVNQFDLEVVAERIQRLIA